MDSLGWDRSACFATRHDQISQDSNYEALQQRRRCKWDMGWERVDGAGRGGRKEERKRRVC